MQGFRLAPARVGDNNGPVALALGLATLAADEDDIEAHEFVVPMEIAAKLAAVLNDTVDECFAMIRSN